MGPARIHLWNWNQKIPLFHDGASLTTCSTKLVRKQYSIVQQVAEFIRAWSLGAQKICCLCSALQLRTAILHLLFLKTLRFIRQSFGCGEEEEDPEWSYLDEHVGVGRDSARDDDGRGTVLYCIRSVRQFFVRNYSLKDRFLNAS